MNTLSRAAREATQLRRAELSIFAPMQISSQWGPLFEFPSRARSTCMPRLGIVEHIRTSSQLWWCNWRRSTYNWRRRRSKSGRNFKNRHSLFVAKSVNNALKRVRRCSAQSATVVTRFEKKLNVQNQRSQFEAPRRRRVELEGRAIIIG